ncbi:MAG: hypothetical protein M9962_07145 [Oligoflexia bacterium]|nr:hypothetical protein [Oligoflexia bacterium]
MRTLMFLISVLCPLALYAEEPSTRMSTNVRTEEGSLDNRESSGTKSSQVQISYDLSSGTLRNFIFRVGLDQAFRDYSRDFTVDRTGSSQPLLVDSNVEYQARLSTEYVSSYGYFTLKGTKTLSKSPYPINQGVFSYSKDFYSYGLKSGFQISVSEQKSPLSFYVDPETFRRSSRATRKNSKTAEVFAEQVLSERWKVRINPKFVENRTQPNSYGFSTQFAWAFLDSAALFSLTGFSREFRTQGYSEDRGFYSSYWQEIQLRKEWSRKISSNLLLGTQLETETARGSREYQKVGVDYFGLDFTGNLSSSLLFGLNGKFSFTNTGYKSLTYGGNIIWQF